MGMIRPFGAIRFAIAQYELRLHLPLAFFPIWLHSVHREFLVLLMGRRHLHYTLAFIPLDRRNSLYLLSHRIEQAFLGYPLRETVYTHQFVLYSKGYAI